MLHVLVVESWSPIASPVAVVNGAFGPLILGVCIGKTPVRGYKRRDVEWRHQLMCVSVTNLL